MATTSRKVSETPVEPGADEDGVFAKRKRSHYRRTQADSFIGFLVHFLLMCFNVYIGVYEAGVIKTLKARGEHIKAFPGIETYGSRWKYFTYINLVSIISAMASNNSRSCIRLVALQVAMFYTC